VTKKLDRKAIRRWIAIAMKKYDKGEERYCKNCDKIKKLGRWEKSTV